MSITKELALEQPMEDLKHEAALNIVRTSNMLSLAASALLRGYGLTEAQFNVLFVLKYKESQWTQSDLGKRLVVTRASITSVLDKLESKALVERREVPGNRRIYHVELTRKGRVLVDKVEPLYRDKVHEALEAFDDKACKRLITALEQIRTSLSRENQ